MIENEEDIGQGMFSLFGRLHHVTQNCANINDANRKFPGFANKHLFYDNENDKHFLIPVYSGIIPFMGSEFIINTSLSLGVFSTQGKLQKSS